MENEDFCAFDPQQTNMTVQKFSSMINHERGAGTDLEYPWNLFGVSTVHICLSDGPHMEEFAV